jgi:hypothetical protein
LVSCYQALFDDAEHLRRALPLRQTQGFMRSVAALMWFDIAEPDFSTLSRRS